MKKALLSLALLASCGAPSVPDGMPEIGTKVNVGFADGNVSGYVQGYEGDFLVLNKYPLHVESQSDETRIRMSEIKAWKRR